MAICFIECDTTGKIFHFNRLAGAVRTPVENVFHAGFEPGTPPTVGATRGPVATRRNPRTYVFVTADGREVGGDGHPMELPFRITEEEHDRMRLNGMENYRFNLVTRKLEGP